MGGLAEKMVIEAVDALSSGDAALAHQVVETDPRLDALQREIEEQATLTIARRQPVANDLREIIGAIRVAGDLERVGDLAKNIAKRALKIGVECRVPRRHRRHQAHERLRDRADEGRARRLCATRRRAGARRLGAGRRSRCLGRLGVPRSADAHDGGSAQHHVLRPSSVLLEEHRADRRSRHQHRRDRGLSGDRFDAADGAAARTARNARTSTDIEADATGAVK